MKQDIIFRLVLAKTLFKNGIKFCDTEIDILNFSHGLIALHDALDNFTGAIISHLKIKLKKGYFLINMLDDIEKYEQTQNSQSTTLTSKNELIQLNTIRNNIKHQGIPPNINHAKGLINPIVIFFHKYSQRYFNLEWEFISLADLIKKDTVKESMKEIESLIEKQQYKNALNQMAIIKFQVFDESFLEIQLNSKRQLFPRLSHRLFPPSEKIKKLMESKNIFPNQCDDLFSDLYDRTKFLEARIDRDLMNKFENFTAKVGINNVKEWKYILKHNHLWGEINWTREIAIFCFDFLIDSIIKYQGEEHNAEQKWFTKIHTIKITDELKLYDKDHTLKYTIPKGEEAGTFIPGRVDGKWEIFDIDDRGLNLYKKDGEKDVFGFFDEGDENKIQFLKTEQFTTDENGNYKKINSL